jgi:two-component system phosphate regulon response regulator OmpR
MFQAQSILIVDDEPYLRQSLSLILQRNGYQVTTAGNAAEALRYLEAGVFHLAFLDIKMPDKDGIALLTEIRSKYPCMPVFILTAHATLDTAMQAVRLGANDYLLKPVDPEIILGRVREALKGQQLPQRRREITSQLHELLTELHQMESPAAPGPEAAAPAAPAQDARFLQRGSFTLDLHTRTVSSGGRTIQLPPSTFNFLASLLRHSPEPVAYEILVQEAQGYSLTRAEARELARGQAHELRKALEPDLRRPQYVITVRDFGYRLVT